MVRAHWASRSGFILAAAGSAIGLGNIWKFPYIAGHHGGGAFVLIYLFFVAFVGLPLMIGEVSLGRAAQISPVGAFRRFGAENRLWPGIGFLGVTAAFLLLSFYAVVAGWAMHYTWEAATGALPGAADGEADQHFAAVTENSALCVGWQVGFMTLVTLVVWRGIRGGIEKSCRIMMPALALMMLYLFAHALNSSGFAEALNFIFGLHTDRLTAAGVLEALGHAFFTLSLGVGGMITYGSYLDKKTDVVGTSILISGLDTGFALLACMIFFPIVFSFGLSPEAGPGLVFVSLPIAFAQMSGGVVLAFVFFLLLVFAALSSAVSLLEIVVSYFIDEKGWTRHQAVLVSGLGVTAFGIPSSLSSSTDLFGESIIAITGKNWFDSVDYLVSNWMLPMGGMGLALFMAWRMNAAARLEAYGDQSRWLRFYGLWLALLKWFIPLSIFLVLLNLIGVFG
ncbi:MAG: sodium-dependent transporter [Planctomycetota bacterium]